MQKAPVRICKPQLNTSKRTSKARRLSPEERLRIVALADSHMPWSKIAQEVHCAQSTVWAVLSKREARQNDAVDAVLSKVEVAARVRSIADAAERPSDKLAGWKLYALMQGYLTPEQATAAQVNINLLSGKDIGALEAEYKQLTGRTLAHTDVSASHSTMLNTHAEQLAQPAELAPAVEPCGATGGGSPPASCDENDSVPPQISGTELSQSG